MILGDTFEGLIQDTPTPIRQKIREMTYKKLNEVEKELLESRKWLLSNYEYFKTNNIRIHCFINGVTNANDVIDNIQEAEFDYHTNWASLMQVVERIESVRFGEQSNDLRFNVEINSKGCRIYRSWTTVDYEHFGWHQTGSKQLSTYEAVVEFLAWFYDLNVKKY